MKRKANTDPGAAAGPAGASEVPTADVRPGYTWVWWLVPLAALVLAAGLFFRARSLRGVEVTVRLKSGWGLMQGDPVRYRGIRVGEVRSIDLGEDLGEVIITASLYSQGDRLARQGSRFWVVRPEIGLAGVVGLETIVGPRYLTVLPGSGSPQRDFIGLESPPVIESTAPGDLEVIVRDDRQGSLQSGAPVLYRQVRVGTIKSVGLTSDAGAVEARLHIEAAYSQLIRQETKFWRRGGISARLGFGGLVVDVESLQTLIAGGIGLATPPRPEAGEVVRTGHRFELADEPDDDWLDWEPLVAIGTAMLPPGSILPDCRRARIAWRQGIFRGSKSVQGWVIATDRGLLGPEDLLRPSDKAMKKGAMLEVAGNELSLPSEPTWSGGGLALVEVELPEGLVIFPGDRMRLPIESEDCLAIADPNAGSLPLAASRLTRRNNVWIVDAAIPIDSDWHGAPVLARSDGKLVGILLVGDDRALVAWLPAGDDREE